MSDNKGELTPLFPVEMHWINSQW